MKEIKDMVLGVAILLMIIIVHLCVVDKAVAFTDVLSAIVFSFVVFKHRKNS